MTETGPDTAAARFRAEIEGEALHPNLGALVAAAAARYPERPLWVSIDGQGPDLTYGAFEAAANRCAGALRALGVVKGTHVGVMLPNVAPFLITWVALARLGAVMVPINIGYTPSELRYTLVDGNVEALVIDNERVAALIGITDRAALIADDRVIVLGAPPAPFVHDWLAMTDGASAALDAAEVGADDLASIQYTSGTTGLPKGCMLSHRYWLIIGKVLARRGPRVERLLVDLPLHYLGAQWRFWMALYAGGTLYVALRYSLSRLIERIRAHDIDFASMFDQVAKLPQSPDDGDNNLKRISIAGLSKDLHATLERRFAAPAREGYGMTEVGATLYMPFEDTSRVGSGSCGIEAPFRRCRIMGADAAPVTPGETGELWVSGAGILQGYYNQPEATAAAFSGEWFRTGDLFRQDADGYYYLVGRIKDMIRRSGENISAQEVEAALHAMPEVRQAAIVAVPDSLRGEEVKAFVVLEPGLGPAEVPPDTIFAHCAGCLARFKVPRYLKYVDGLPKTASNKVAKHLLTAADDPRRGSYDRVERTWRR
jgi:crotonobetaine/carnitine-CoA ligase